VAVEEFNRRAVRALERAQQATGIRSAEAFAGRLSDRAGGSPDGSTYRRWIRGESAIPAWALIAAADESRLSPNDLLGWDGSATGDAEIRFEAELRTVQQELEQQGRLLAHTTTTIELLRAAMQNAGIEVDEEPERRASGDR
jgi:hypothetical protein